MNKFNIAKGYEEKGINIPERATKQSAGYDIESAVNIVVPSYLKLIKNEGVSYLDGDSLTLVKNTQELIETIGLKPVMIPTGLNIELDDDKYMEVVVRSSIGAKTLLTMPNNVGVVDSDFCPNEFFIPLINLSPFDVEIKKGEKIAQGIIHKYYTVDDEEEISTTRNGGFGSTNE